MLVYASAWVNAWLPALPRLPGDGPETTYAWTWSACTPVRRSSQRGMPRGSRAPRSTISRKAWCVAATLRRRSGHGRARRIGMAAGTMRPEQCRTGGDILRRTGLCGRLGNPGQRRQVWRLRHGAAVQAQRDDAVGVPLHRGDVGRRPYIPPATPAAGEDRDVLHAVDHVGGGCGDHRRTEGDLLQELPVAVSIDPQHAIDAALHDKAAACRKHPRMIGEIKVRN